MSTALQQIREIIDKEHPREIHASDETIREILEECEPMRYMLCTTGPFQEAKIVYVTIDGVHVVSNSLLEVDEVRLFRIVETTVRLRRRTNHH